MLYNALAILRPELRRENNTLRSGVVDYIIFLDHPIMRHNLPRMIIHSVIVSKT
jgi:hypothetical protein